MPFAKNPAAATAVKRPAGADKKRNQRLVGDEYDRLLEASHGSAIREPDETDQAVFPLAHGITRMDDHHVRNAIVYMFRNGLQ